MATTSRDFLDALTGRSTATAPRRFQPGITETEDASGLRRMTAVDIVPPGTTETQARQTALNDAQKTSVASGSGGHAGASGGHGSGAGFRDKGLDFLNPRIESAMNAAILGLLTNGGLVGRGFEDAANLLREEEKASTLRNMDRNAELFNSRNMLGSGPRLEAQTDIGDMGQQNLFAALVELELQRLGLQQQGQLGGISGALNLGGLGLNEFLAALQLAQATVPHGPAGPVAPAAPAATPTPQTVPSIPPGSAVRDKPLYQDSSNPFERTFLEY